MDYDGTAAGGLPREGALDLLFADAFLFFGKTSLVYVIFWPQQGACGILSSPVRS